MNRLALFPSFKTMEQQAWYSLRHQEGLVGAGPHPPADGAASLTHAGGRAGAEDAAGLFHWSQHVKDAAGLHAVPVGGTVPGGGQAFRGKGLEVMPLHGTDTAGVHAVLVGV